MARKSAGTPDIRDHSPESTSASAALHLRTVEVNEALVLGSLRQHELTEVAERLNVQLKREIAARKNAARELEEKARLIDLSNDAIIVRDLKDKIRLWNKGAEKLFGWTSGEVIGKDLHSFLQTEFPKPYEEIIEDLHREGHFNVEVVQIARDGRRVRSLCGWVLDRATESIFTSYTDITERTKAVEALRESEERYRTLFNTMDEGFCVIEIIFDEHDTAFDFEYIEVNPSFEALTGLHAAVGKRISDFFPDVERFWFEMYGKVVSTGEPIRFQNEVKPMGRWFDLYCFRVGGEESRKVAVLFTNITERINAESALRESEERYRTLFTSIDEGFCVIEMVFDEHERPVDFRFLEVNPTFGKQTGLFEATGKLMRDLVPELEPHWFEIYGKVATTGETIRFVNVAKDMGRWFDAYACRVGGPGSRKVAIVFNDITSRMESEGALVLAHEQLAGHAAGLEGLVADRTAALTATNRKLEGSVVSIEKGKEEFRELFLESEAVQKKLRRLTRQFLNAQEDERREISRELHDDIVQTLVGVNVELSALANTASIGTKAFKEKIAATQQMMADAVAAVHRFARDLRPTVLDDLGLNPALLSYLKDYIERTGIRVDFSTYADVENLKIGVRTVLFRVAQEALTNVARHAGVSRAELEISEADGTVCMEIRDNGKGFDVGGKIGPKKNDRLGLLGMKERVEMVGGTFNVESSPGNLTRVCVHVKNPAPRKKRRGKNPKS